MSAQTIFTNIREKMESTDLNLRQIADRANVPYHRLWRFSHGSSLSLEDAEAVYVALFGKTFISKRDA